MTKSLVIATNGEHEVIDLPGYAELSAAIGGYIECVPSNDSVTIWCNEEGKLNGLPSNDIAVVLWSEFDKYECINGGDWLVGTIVVQGPIDEDGESTDCPDDVVEIFRHLALTLLPG